MKFAISGAANEPGTTGNQTDRDAANKPGTAGNQKFPDTVNDRSSADNGTGRTEANKAGTAENQNYPDTVNDRSRADNGTGGTKMNKPANRHNETSRGAENRPRTADKHTDRRMLNAPDRTDKANTQSGSDTGSAGNLSANHTLRIGSQTIPLATPVVMTIINVTPDSFYAGSRTPETEAIRERVREAVEQGAAILDVGGYSSRPGAEDISPDEEIRRLDQALQIIRTDFPDMPVSLDTFRARVAETIIDRYGPCLVNDITGGQADPDIMAFCGRLDVPFLVMHMRGTPQTMQQFTQYDNYLEDIHRYFEDRIVRCREAGIRQIIIDPGFGFSKTVEQNYALLAHLRDLKSFGLPVLAGVSRKSMIWKPLGIRQDDALNGTTALHWECLRQGADILRVHDTREAVEVIRLHNLYNTCGMGH